MTTMMQTFDTFRKKWQTLHHPSMDVDGDAAFYYEVYGRLFGLAVREARSFDEAVLFSLLLYTENIVAIGLDGVYEYMYRSLGDMVVRGCDELGMNAGATSQVHHIVSDAVAEARRSSLRTWMEDSVLSRDFSRLSGMMAYLAEHDRALRLVYPNLHYREAVFRRLAGEGQAAQRLLWSDLAFNWRDKHGDSLPFTLARQFRMLASSVDGPDRAALGEVADCLSSIRSERLDVYTVMGKKDERTVTLRHRDGRLFKDVVLPSPWTGVDLPLCLAAQLVTCQYKTYICGPVIRLQDEESGSLTAAADWNAVEESEKDDARRHYFTTPFGRRISLYEDLYMVPGDAEEAYYNSLGIYMDEPNIFDFLDCLAPGTNVRTAE